MRLKLWAEDVKGILLSRRASYSLIIMAILALTIAIIVKFAPEGLKNALEAAAPGSAGVFEYLWIGDVLDKLLLLTFVSFGSFAVCDLEDDRMVELSFSKAQSRLDAILRRLTASIASFLIIFITGVIMVSVIGNLIVGDLDASLFIQHQLMVLPLCLFVISLTFFLSVPLRTTAPTVITSFGISLALSFTYTFLVMGGDTIPSIFNPLALGYRILLELQLEGAVLISLFFSCALLGGGIIWFLKKDL